MSTYFLSYARADQTISLRFANDLIAAGIPVWVDQYDIHPSQHWDRAVETAVRGCEGLIVMLSPRSAASPNVADEVSVAIDDGKTIIPILVEVCKPPLRMARMQFIDATRDYQAALAKCVASINLRAPTAFDAGLEAVAAPGIAETPGVAARLPAAVLSQAELRLTGFIGPVAAVLVRQAVGAASETELYQSLAKSIRDEAERKSFLAWLSEPREPGKVVTPRMPPPPATEGAADVGPEQLDALTKALTQYIGPIAKHLVTREGKLGGSLEALRQRLAERIADAKDRAAFLKEAAKA